MIYKELTETVIGSAFEVMNELGCGFLESVYEKALSLVLTEKGLEVESQKQLSVAFRGHRVGMFYADLVVNGSLILELKAVKNLLPEHQAQLINYLKASGYPLGLLLNFGNPKVEFKRLFPSEKT